MILNGITESHLLTVNINSVRFVSQESVSRYEEPPSTFPYDNSPGNEEMENSVNAVITKYAFLLTFLL